MIASAQYTITDLYDGNPNYTWVKYADTASGTGMSDSPTGKKYVGMAFNKASPTESTTASDYSWSPLYDNVSVGGKNLVLKSNEPKTGTTFKITEYTLSEDLIVGQQYTITVKGTLNTGTSGTQQFYIASGTDTIFLSYTAYNSTRGVWTGTGTPMSGTYTKNKISVYNYPYGTTGASTIEWIKLERGNISTDWTPAPEDTQGDISVLQTDVADAKIQLQPNNITQSVIQNTTFQTVINNKADMDDLADYTPLEDYNTLNQQVKDLDSAVDSIDLTSYVQKTELTTALDGVTADISKTGGVNLVKNSTGYSSLDFWTPVAGTVLTTTNNELEALGFGMGFYSPYGSSGSIEQATTVTPGKKYTLSMYTKKTRDETLDSCSEIEIYEGGILLTEIGLQDGQAGDFGYEMYSITITPTTEALTLRVNFQTNCDAIIAGIMLNFGAIALPWTPSKSEAYNTNVRLDLNGIRVEQKNAGTVTGATIMTPERFGGYYDVNGDGVIDIGVDSPDEVFRMDREQFIMKQATVKEEITMGNIKIIKVEGGGFHGWAFVPVQ